MIIIRTLTSEDFSEVVKWAFDNDIRWRYDIGRNIKEYFWKDYGSETCIKINGKILSYSDRDFYTSRYEMNIFSMTQFRKYIRKYLNDKFVKKYDLR